MGALEGGGRLYYQGVEVDVTITPIEAALRDMTPASPCHAEVVGAVHSMLRDAVRASGSGCKAYTSDLRVYLPDGRYIHPDASVVCGPIVPPTRSGDAWLLRAYGPDDAVRIDAIGATVSVRALYEGVTLDPVVEPEPAVSA